MLPAILGIGGLIGQFLGGAAKGASDGRMTQAQLQNQQDQTRTAQYGIGQNAQFQQADTDLARKAFEENARGDRAKQAVLGALLGNLQDAKINVPGIQTASVSGGLRPSALGEGGRAAGSLLNQQALLKMLQGDQFEGGKILSAPGVQGIPKAGLFEKIAGIGGLIGGGMGAVGQGLQSFGPTPSVPGLGVPSAGVPQGVGQQVGAPEMPAAPTGMAEILAAIQALTNPTGTGAAGRT
jgi:hypothetical protein